MAQASLRTIALAYKDMSYAEFQRILNGDDTSELLIQESPIEEESKQQEVVDDCLQIDEDKLLSENEPISEDDDFKNQ